MKKLIKRLTRIADSSNYSQLRSDFSSITPVPAKRTSRRRCQSLRCSGKKDGIPQGHLPVYVGDEMERFIVSAELLNHPIFIKLLNISAQEYGYEQQGALRIPCHVFVFERVLEAVRLGHDEAARDMHDLLSSVSDESYSISSSNIFRCQILIK